MNKDQINKLKSNIKHPAKYITFALSTSSNDGRILIGILSFLLYITVCVASVAIIASNHDEDKIKYYENYMDEQEAELQSLTHDKFLLQQTNAEILEDMQIVRELSQVGKQISQ